jgi:7-keto-8-aminopelargonate synthetase-like enzyme
MNFDQFLTGELERIQSAGLRRSQRVINSPQGPEVSCDGRLVANFASNDYLGLAAHPNLRDAARGALDEAGVGSGASRLICGTHSHHKRLEEALARFKRTESALSFSSGYAAALGTIPALAGKGDVIVLDKLCHACLVDGARLAGASMRVFPHNGLEKLESHLRWAVQTFPDARVLVLVESVYSMDGDRAPLREIVELKERFGAWLLVDEAHAGPRPGRRAAPFEPH